LRGDVSSAFLYLGIVAIWAFVLVPRWLRRPHALPQSEGETGAGYSAEPQHGNGDYESQDEADAYAANPARTAPAQVQSLVGTPGYLSSPGHAPVKGPRRTLPPLSRAGMLQARRRLLTMLVLLTAAAGACIALKITSWWVCIPPAGMLGMFLLLLREAALADAEQARRRAAMELRVRAARQRAHTDRQQRPAQPSAQIIDISARVGDQLYDQYADATVRAVGD
jgi:hypothetical protein